MTKISSCMVVFLFIITTLNLRAQSTPFSKALTEGWSFHKVGNCTWYPATVPGCVHTDLLSNKIITNPFYRDNESKMQWIDKNSWEYKTEFTINAKEFARKNISLDFKGLDTYAEVFLNDIHILTTDNMFCEWEVNVKDKLREGTNTLRVLFHSPVVMGLLNRDKFNLEAPNGFNLDFNTTEWPAIGPYTRKAGYMYGWDWGPKLTTSGIWRNVFLKGWDDTRLKEFQLMQQEISVEKAKISGKIIVESSKEQTSNILISYTLKGKSVQLPPISAQLHPGKFEVSVNIDIPKPQLWWPNGLGEHPIYDFTAKIETQGQLTDSLHAHTGLRDIKLIRKPDNEGGTTFYFEVNGIPVFIKGSNYIPSDIFPSRVTHKHYEDMLKSTADANINMLRVWGGGIYESDEFYDICDQQGIMIWQDLAFAIYLTPDYPEFYESIKTELVQNIRRLRNHPSIAIWCGNNETEMIWNLMEKKFFGLKTDDDNSMLTSLLSMLPPPGKVMEETTNRVLKSYDTLYYQIIPDIIAKNDGKSRDYWPSSPIGDWRKPITVKKPHSGDIHFYIAMLNLPFSAYLETTSHFFSEHGFQAWPDKKVVEEFTAPNDRNESSPVMAAHNKALGGNPVLSKYILMYYQKPKDFDAYLYLSQVLQAEGMKLAMETHRRWMPYTMGTMYWQLNDVWPVASWSSLDYKNQPKALHYFVKKIFQPILIVPSNYKNELKVNLVSDKLKSQEGKLEMKLLDFHGKTLWTKEQMVKTPINTSEVVFESKTDAFLQKQDTSNVVFSVKLWKGKELVSSNLMYFASPKYLKLEDPTISKKIIFKDGIYSISLTSSTMVKNLCLSTDAEGKFSDNYFDLLPGETITVKFFTEGQADNFENTLKFMSLVNSFEKK